MKSLQNGEIHPDRKPNILPWIKESSNAFFIRINTSDEVPSYLFDPIAYASGVFKDEGGIYYGVGRKMDTIQIKKTKTKYANPSEFFRQPKNTEYIPLGFTDERERDLAALLVQDLRDIGITFGTHTAQPYPFHMLRSLKKYMNQTAYTQWEIEPEFSEGNE
ncbi:RNaseH domain-containing protein [Paenibacillus endophyticus]|uniref:RNaseH domain-containing protein n=1 Tax=Paenibacillus endophyticus TaxID=1294268 RepID=UPI0035E417B2